MFPCVAHRVDISVKEHRKCLLVQRTFVPLTGGNSSLLTSRDVSIAPRDADYFDVLVDVSMISPSYK